MKKYIFALLILIVSALFFNIHSAGESTFTPSKHTIDKQPIIDQLKQQKQLIGYSGSLHKEFTYSDKRFYGDVKYKIYINAEFTMGYDLSNIEGSVSVIDDSIAIQTPPVSLLTLDIPYENSSIERDVGWLRKRLSDEQLQEIYKYIRTKIVEDIMSDSELLNKAKNATDQSLMSLLEMNRRDKIVIE